MRDFNFFSPYIEGHQKSRNKVQKTAIFAVLAVLAITTFPTMNYMKIKSLQQEIHSLESYAGKEDIRIQLNTVEDKKNKISIINKYLAIAQAVSAQLEQVDKIHSNMLVNMADAIPQAVFIKTLNITASDVQIQGVSDDPDAVAQYEYNLKQLDWLVEVHVGIISAELEEKDNYYFTMNCKLKDVKPHDEANK
jgi:Tfp pilus assembly protein PilN